MRVKYYKSTDSFYIDLSENPSTHSQEVAEGVVLDYDAAGNLVGIDIDNASAKVTLNNFIVSGMPWQIDSEPA